MKGYTERFGGESLSAGFDMRQFGDLELVGTALQYREVQTSLWERIGVGGSIAGKALVAGGNVYFGACDQTFYCLTADGKERWRFRTEGVILEGGAAFGDLVCFGSADGNAYAVDRETGKERWRFSAKRGIFNAPVYHGGRVYISSYDSNLYCLDAETGRQVWRFKVKKGSPSQPLIVDGKLYFGYEDGNLYCIDTAGTLVWKYPVNHIISAWPSAYYQNTVFFGCMDGNLYAVSSAGRLRWRFQAKDLTNAPVVWGGRLYFGSWDKHIYCLDAATGALVWKFATKGLGAGQVEVAVVVCYAGSSDNTLYALDAATGKEKWRFPTNGLINRTLVAGGRVYFGCWDCTFYCLSLEGKRLWTFQTSMSSPSVIAPPEHTFTASLELAISPATDKEQDDRYAVKSLGEGGSESVYTFRSEYATKSQYTMKKR